MLDAEPVRWGALGCARILERRMIPGFRAAGSDSACLTAVASRSVDKSASFAAAHGIPRSYGSYKDLLRDDDVEVVYIPLPNDQHCEWTLRCLEAGKHVLCDKPIALTLSDAVKMADAARACGLRLMEGFMWRHHPQHRRAADIIRSGRIGEVVHYFATFTYPAERDARNIRWNAVQGGGALLDVGVYPIDAARFHMGGEPVAVTACSAVDPEFGVDVRIAILLEWADGRTASLLGGFDQPFTSRYEIRGRDGSVALDRAFQVGVSGVEITIRTGADGLDTEQLPHIDQYGLEIAHFSACVRDPSVPLAPGETGVAQARVVEAARLSAREKRRVEIREIEG